MRLGSVGIVVSAAALLASAPSAGAAITVNTTKDETFSGDGSCSLREAVLAADGSPSPDCPGSAATGVTTIALRSGTYHLSLGSGLILVRPIEIEGVGGPAKTVIDGDHHNRVLQNDSNQATIANLTITGGRTADAGDGADGTSVSLGGQAAGAGTVGGGVFNDGSMNIINTVITGNATGNGGRGGAGFSASTCGDGGAGGDAGGGGGIFNEGSLTLTRVTVTDNSTGDGGDGGASGSNTGSGAGCAPGASGAGGDGAGILNQGSLHARRLDGLRQPHRQRRIRRHRRLRDQRTRRRRRRRCRSGGGIASTVDPLTISGSTISGNLTGNGGAGGRWAGHRRRAGRRWRQRGPRGWDLERRRRHRLGAQLDRRDQQGGRRRGRRTRRLRQRSRWHGGQGGSGGTGGSGGGIYEAQPGSITVASATVADNAAGGGGNLGSGGDGNGSPGIDGMPGDPGTGGGSGRRPDRDALRAGLDLGLQLPRQLRGPDHRRRPQPQLPRHVVPACGQRRSEARPARRLRRPDGDDGARAAGAQRSTRSPPPEPAARSSTSAASRVRSPRAGRATSAPTSTRRPYVVPLPRPRTAPIRSPCS